MFFAVEYVNFLIFFVPKLYESPKDNFGSKYIGKSKWLVKAWTTGLLIYRTTSTSEEALSNEVELTY